jgi:SPP1 family predicted phage head-tail adaptor
MFSAGALRYRVKIQRPIETRNSTGETVLTWEDFGDRWAAIETLTGREVIANSRQEFTMTHRVVVRGAATDGPPAILPQFRVLWGNRRLEINSVLSVDHGRWIEMICSEIKT